MPIEFLGLMPRSVVHHDDLALVRFVGNAQSHLIEIELKHIGVDAIDD